VPVAVTWLAVEPLDTIMVRDGRNFDAGVSNRATGTPPPPSTLGGVVGRALGRRVERVLGSVVAAADELLFPAPVDVVRHEGVLRRLSVREREASETCDLDEPVRLSHGLRGDGEPVTSWIAGSALRDWLAAEAPWQPAAELDGLADDEVGLREPPWCGETRLGLARRWAGEFTGTAAPGLLYLASHLRPRHGVTILVPVEDSQPVRIDQDLVPLGGRGRLAHVRTVPAPDLPQAPATFPGGRVTVYLATPALPRTDRAWPDVRLWCPPEATLCALALGGPVPVAAATSVGASLTSRRLAWAAPAGTVFYLDFGDAEAAKRWSDEHHGRLLGGVSGSDLVTAGFGMCLTGRW
jgi:CRISPR-associated protein (Cas_Cmr3)